MRTVAIVGVGLIGGSFGLALRKAGFAGNILGVSSARTVEAACRIGACDSGASLEQAAEQADLIFLSQPISGILQTIEELGRLVNRRIVVTDAGSTKVAIDQKARGSLREALFIGGHPMAGKELRGVEASDADLFRGRPWIFTSACDGPVAREFFGYVEKFGARRVSMRPAEHDRTVAWASHMPQILSTTLAALLAEQAPETCSIAGPGLLDMTRLAMSSYDLWKDIIETNRGEIAEALEAFAHQLRRTGNDFEAPFSSGAEFARQLRGVKE